MKKKEMTSAEAIKELIRIKENYSYDGTEGGFDLEDCLLQSEIEALDLAIDFLEKHRGLPRAGDTVYYAHYVPGLPSEADVEELVVSDISEKGMFYYEKDSDWYDFRNPDERLFLTKDEAEAKLEELKRAVHERPNMTERWREKDENIENR